MATVEERLQALEDQQAIYQVVCGYGYSVDGCNAESVGDRYVEDGVYAVGDIHGRLDLFARLVTQIDDDDAARVGDDVRVVGAKPTVVPTAAARIVDRRCRICPGQRWSAAFPAACGKKSGALRNRGK